MTKYSGETIWYIEVSFIKRIHLKTFSNFCLPQETLLQLLILL